MTNKIKELCIRELVNSNDNYIIPIYQRNYAWGESEIIQLIQDIIDYLPEEQQHYYLGTLVVSEREEGRNIVYETIDGQQRLTTLSLLVNVLKNNRTLYGIEDVKEIQDITFNLDFESRKISTKTLNAIYNGNFDVNQDYNESIKAAYELIEKIIPIKLKENKISTRQFCNYLFNNVKILRVPVPDDTDLNHYFEIMNNRGEQLEKHEILKSRLLKILNGFKDVDKCKLYSECFNLIWEACSNMEKYVQYGFSVDQRDVIFVKNDWNRIDVKNFDDFCIKFKLLQKEDEKKENEKKENEETKRSLVYIINNNKIKLSQPESEEKPERFNSVINFPNFLLHVLKIQTQQDIQLDDKRLIKIFHDVIDKQENQVEFVGDFIFNLLKCKYLFDKYIIKREYISGIDRWCLKRLNRNDKNRVSYLNTFGDENNGSGLDDNRRILMLLSMFHVSAPTPVYKYWLNAALDYVFKNEEVESIGYIQYLESLARSFVFDRFLASERINYHDIIYNNKAVVQNSIKDLDFNKTTFDSIENNLLFNYLDYLLWSREYSRSTTVRDFEFTFRSSVEHYYPQQPMSGFDKLEQEHLHSLGNLCLISHSKNSRLSNFMPPAKKNYYAENSIDSIKQYIMMNDYKPEDWGPVSIQDHFEKMKSLLLEQVNKKFL